MPVALWLRGGSASQQADTGTDTGLTLAQCLKAPSFWACTAGIAAFSGIAVGIITVAFFAIWSDSYGKRHLGRMQGLAQMCSVFASALGPLLLERGHAFFGTYAKTLIYAAPGCVSVGLLTLILKPRPHA